MGTLYSIFIRGGPFMWPLLAIAIIILFLTIKNTNWLYWKVNSDSIRVEQNINAILFFGVLSLFIAFFGYYLGLNIAMNAIYRANDISPVIIASGYSQALIPLVFSLGVFIFAYCVWYLLRWRLKRLVSIDLKQK